MLQFKGKSLLDKLLTNDLGYISNSLEKGLDTYIQENGTNLSGGDKQK